MRLSVVAFTARGAVLADRLCRALPDTEAHAPARYCTGAVLPLEGSSGTWAAQRFETGRALLFIGAAGIAVRAIAPQIRGKDQDPAVLCADEAGRYVVPLLAGHIGGANRLARELADILGGEAVLTTATDVNGVFSPDAWAAENGCAVADIREIKYISAALLDGEPVGLRSEFPMVTAPPPGISPGARADCGIEIALSPTFPWAHTLHLVPRCIVVGMGCRRGVDADTLERRLLAALEEAGVPSRAVGVIASIDVKAEEPGLIQLAARLRARFETYPALRLREVPGDFTASSRVEEHVGVDNVCERAAVCTGGELILKKTAGDGVTVALARLPWNVAFSDTGVNI